MTMTDKQFHVLNDLARMAREHEIEIETVSLIDPELAGKVKPEWAHTDYNNIKLLTKKEFDYKLSKRKI